MAKAKSKYVANGNHTPSAFEPETDELPWFPSITTFYGFGILIVLGWFRDVCENLLGFIKKPKKGYAPLLDSFEAFYTRRLYDRISDAWNRPIASCPSNRITVMDRELGSLELTKRKIDCINLGSYNYLGFADPDSPCQESVLKSLEHYSVATCSTRNALGTTRLHRELEEFVAQFLNKPASMIFGMGFGVNSTGIPFLMGKGDLVISDKMNHASIVFGCRSSGAKIRVFDHNNVAQCEKLVRDAIIHGQPRTHRPWRKIMIIVEGVYSMEGHTADLKPIVEIKKKYGVYLFVDEAHSIGALGRTGRGICEHAGVDPADVDILMGTFTKSFGAVGGYIASSKEVVATMRRHCSGAVYSQSLSPVACQQIISALKIIAGLDGTDNGAVRLQQLKDNANYFRRRLIAMGAKVLGDNDSPVVPVLIGDPAKLSAFSRECLNHNLAVVVVGFPATAILSSRARFCISASHTKEDLDTAVEKLDYIMNRVHLKYKSKMTG